MEFGWLVQSTTRWLLSGFLYLRGDEQKLLAGAWQGVLELSDGRRGSVDCRLTIAIDGDRRDALLFYRYEGEGREPMKEQADAVVRAKGIDALADWGREWSFDQSGPTRAYGPIALDQPPSRKRPRRSRLVESICRLVWPRQFVWTPTFTNMLDTEGPRVSTYHWHCTINRRGPFWQRQMKITMSAFFERQPQAVYNGNLSKFV